MAEGVLYNVDELSERWGATRDQVAVIADERLRLLYAQYGRPGSRNDEGGYLLDVREGLWSGEIVAGVEKLLPELEHRDIAGALKALRSAQEAVDGIFPPVPAHRDFRWVEELENERLDYLVETLKRRVSVAA